MLNTPRNTTKLSALLGSASVFTLASIINAAIPFFLLPILTRYLSPSDYGIVAMFQILTALALPLVGLSIYGAIRRQYFEREEIDLPVYIGNCLVLLLAATAVWALVFWIFATPIGELFAFPASWLSAVWMVCAAQVVTQVLLAMWQVQNRSVRFGIFQILLTAANLGLSIGLVVGLSFDWRGRVLAQVVAPVLFGMIAFGLLIRQGWVRFRIRPAYMRHALRFGVPLIPHMIGMATITMIDRVMVANLIDVRAAGIYMVAAQVCAVLFLLQGSFHQAWVPWVFDQLKNGNAADKQRIVAFTYVYDACFLLLALLLAWIGPWLLGFLVGEAFADAGAFIFWLALAYAFSAMYKMVATFIFYQEKTHLLAGITFFTGVVNIGATYVLILRNGAVGAAQGTALAFLSAFLLTWVLAAKVYKMPWFSFFRQTRQQVAPWWS